MAKINRDDIEAIRQKPVPKKSSISVGMSACGLAAGAEEVYKTFSEEIKKRNLPVEVYKSGCAGMCYAEPIVEVKVEGLPNIIYGKVNRELAMMILEKHVMEKTLLNDCIFEARV